MHITSEVSSTTTASTNSSKKGSNNRNSTSETNNNNTNAPNNNNNSKEGASSKKPIDTSPYLTPENLIERTVDVLLAEHPGELVKTGSPHIVSYRN